MTIAGIKFQYDKTQKSRASILGRILKFMVGGQEHAANNIKNTNLKTLTDLALKELGYSDSDIVKIRKAPSSGQIF